MTNLIQNNPSFYDDINFTINIENLNLFNGTLGEDDPNLENVVNSVNATYIASYSNGDKHYEAVKSFSPGLPYPESSDNYTDYSSLTESQIIAWLEQQPSDATYKHSLALSIEEQVNAKPELALPWLAS
jgi:hypothetical protein|tara:strand:+ start:87 stop:473 length:387 start_codon:yes stop_codon:yes gene_type:complete